MCKACDEGHAGPHHVRDENDCWVVLFEEGYTSADIVRWIMQHDREMSVRVMCDLNRSMADAREGMN